MSWFATDDRFWSHRKVIRLRRSEYYAQAVAVWTLCGSWAAGDPEAKSTGVVPLAVVAGMQVPDWDLAVKALIDVGLWEETSDPDIAAFHDWGFWNGPGARTKRLEKRMEDDRIRQQRRRSEGWSRDQSRDPDGLSRDQGVTNGKGVGFGTEGFTNEVSTSSRRKRDVNTDRKSVV